MIAASVVFLTPRGALLALGVVVPLAALALARRREGRARAALGLAAPSRSRGGRRALCITAVAGLLGIAASQPAIRTSARVETRTDAQVVFVVDNSRSMLASRQPGAPTRIARARAEALRIRDELPDVPAGVATMTDHVLPDLLPVSDRNVFAQTVLQAVQVGNPPPVTQSVTATNLGSLGALGTQSFFPPSAKRRVVVVLTDGESRPFDAHQTAEALGHDPGVTPIFVHVWSAHESIFGAGGQPESAYHPDPTSTEALAGLAQASGGKVFGEGRVGAVARAVRSALGRGPTRPEGIRFSTWALGPYFALAALLPLFLLLWEGGAFPFVGRRVLRPDSADDVGSAVTSSRPAERDRVAV